MVSAISLGFAPVTVWLAREQLRYSRRVETAFSLAVVFSATGVVINGGRQVSVTVANRGAASVENLVACVVHGDSHVDIEPAVSLRPGARLDLGGLTLPSTFQGELFLHLSWPEPRSGKPIGGVRYQAVRIALDGEIQLWRWSRLVWFRRFLGFPLGRWKVHKPRRISPRMLPGWPHGPAESDARWS